LPLLGAVMLVGPYNKHLRLKRRAFATKCAGFLRQGVRVVIIDIVTSHLANLHNEIMALVPGTVSWRFPAEAELYAVAYRPVLREERAEIDLWPATCALGAPLPTLPLRLTGDRFVPVDFETTYQETCRRRRIG
ncbi:MAG TPA: DUF4058 domain-containing protein, partial [Gemmataceae bacterium]